MTRPPVVVYTDAMDEPQEMLQWAIGALKAGRSSTYVESVAGKKVYQRAMATHLNVNLSRQETVISAARERAETYFKPKFGPKIHVENLAMKEVELHIRLQRRRRFLLACMYSRHWDMIWFLIHSGMSRRTVARIYGWPVLIWVTGGGIDDTVPVDGDPQAV